MAECVSNSNSVIATDGSVGTDTEHTGKTIVSGTALHEKMEAAQEAMNRRASAEQLSTASETTVDPTYADPTNAAQVSARATARMAVNPRSEIFQNWGIKGQAALEKVWQDAVTLVNGTSIKDSTFWTNFQNRVGKWFENDRHDLVHWLNHIGHIAGRLAYQNPIVQSFTGMIPKIRGVNSKFMNRHYDIMREMESISIRTGRKVEDLFEDAGHYLNYLHTPEGNRNLLDNWFVQLDKLNKEKVTIEQRAALQQQLDALPKTKENRDARDALKAQLKELPKSKRTIDEIEKETGELQRKIKELQDNLENPNPPKGLFSRGYTDAQARNLMAEIERTSGMTREELRTYAKRISDEYNFITVELAREGLIDPAKLAALPNFEWYAPQLSRDGNLAGVSNDATYYVANSQHLMEGMTGTPDSAATSLGFFARRAATEIGMQDFSANLYALWKRAHDNNQYIGLRMANVGHGTDAGIGIIVNVPVRQKDGSIVFEKKHLYFDPSYQWGNISGSMLNNALNSNYKLGNAVIEAMRTATSYYGQSFTRFNPGFAIVGGFRDFMERGFHMLNRAYYTDEGVRVDGYRLVTQFYANSRRAGDMLRQAIYGKATEGSAAANYFNEFQREGLFQKYLPDKLQNPQTVEELAKQYGRASTWLEREGLGKWVQELQKPQLKELNRGLELAKTGGKMALRELDKWNDWLQNSAAFSHYITLREAGLSPKRAASYALDMMDMSKAGTITNYLSVISPFMRPTMQGAKAIATTLGLNARTPAEIFKEGKNGWIATASAGIAFGLIYPLVRESLGQDEAGQWRMDTMKVSQLTSSLPIGYGGEGEYFKMPMGFGPTRIAATMAVVMDRVFRGMMEPAEGAFEVMFAAGRDLVPSNTPQFDFKENPAAYITRMVAPAGLTPFIELGTNTNAFGGKVYNDYDPNKASSEQGRKTTPAIWHKVARWVHQQTGMDLAPEQYMHFIKSMTHGPLRLITTSITDTASRESPHLRWEQPTAYGPLPQWLGVMGTTLFFGKARNTEQHGYYDAKRDILGEVRRLGVDMTKEGKEGAEGFQVIRDKLLAAGMDPQRAEIAILLKESEDKLRGLGTAFSKKWGKWYDTDDPDALKDDFLKFEDDQNAIYIDFLQKVQAL